MSQECHNCATRFEDTSAHEDWEAVCSHCKQLLWLRAGDVVECRVTKITPFGIFVELGDRVTGIVHITELTHQRIGHPSEVVEVGNRLQALVLRVDVAERKIGLSCKRLPPLKGIFV
jgi:ribosomal protein S1